MHAEADELHELFGAELVHGVSESRELGNRALLDGTERPSIVALAERVDRAALRPLSVVGDVSIADHVVFAIEERMRSHVGRSWQVRGEPAKASFIVPASGHPTGVPSRDKSTRENDYG
jgi:hypothetical protein